ncbi:hypothetical protein [Kitasatospora kifunensis]|uniref:Chromosome segregation ATPase n=1 Tax=Kitasatospora kifunensis TaxID=58351 RepID=A0A7W7QXT8_KITKI|nr:hypothetical protein [Kitasatospora kifunensis]MBB4921767.1 hypothetical protein [Kitasatospora kifunensis]
MYELNRVRLYSIGPAGARYADTVLDLRGVGEPVANPAPQQPGLFGEEPQGPPRRPAPAGVLFLENGGGKSVLLKLIFSVMLPGHRNTLGGASSGVLRKFLLADDCGHVALEWQHTVTGELIVVGKVSEWRGRQVSSDPRKFAETWYSFRPAPGLTLDSLPVAERAALGDPSARPRGRRRTMKGFRDALTEAGKAHPYLDLTFEDGHDRWTEHLGELGLDPELFRYQREMNADEGEAAGLFAVKHDADFTDLLLRAVTDTRDTDGLADLVHGFAAKLGRRAELTAERDFTGGSLDLLERIVAATTARETVREAHRGAERRTRRLAQALAARAGAERDRAQDLAIEVAAAASAVTAAEADRTRHALITAELTHRHATLSLAAATTEAAGLRRELLDARTLYAAWQAAEVVLRQRAAADRAARVAAAIREAELDAAPALAARAQAAGALAHALEAAAGTAEERAEAEEARAAELQEDGARAQADSLAAATAGQKARSDADHLRQRLAEVEQETQAAVAAGWIDPTTEEPDPARAALHAADAEQAATVGLEQARAAAEQATARTREAAAAEGRAELAAARASDARSATQRALAAERRTAVQLAAEPRLAELLGLSPYYDGEADESSADGSSGVLTPDVLDRAAEDLTELLDSAVSSAERTLFDLRTAAADDSRILAALGDGGLLPPGPDVLATVEYLGEQGVPALPGWRYLAQSVDPLDHEAILAARPELVDGVVVTDPSSLDRAREALQAAALLPRSTVAVGTAAALIAPITHSTDGPAFYPFFVVPPNPAMHDESAADTERRELRARAGARDEHIRELAARLGADRALAARLASWQSSCPPGTLAELAEATAAAAEQAELATAQLATARAEHAEAEADRAAAAAVHEERREAAQQTRRRADALAGLAFRLRERPSWTRSLRELAEDTAECERRQAACAERAQACDEDRRAAQRAADDARRTARTLRAERAELSGIVTPTEELPTASLPALREAYRAAAQLYEKVGVGADLRAEQARAESDETAAQAELDRLTNKVRTRAEELLNSSDGADGPARQAAAARAEELVATIEARSAVASEQLGRLRGEVERSAPASGEAHTELPEELVPTDPEHAQQLLRGATGELAERREALESARIEHSELLRTLQSAQSAAADFDEAAAQLRDGLRDHAPEEGEPTAEPYLDSLAEARSAATETRRALRTASAELTSADLAVRDACDALVRHANAARYEAVRTPARQQIRELPAAALPEHAAAWAAAFAPRLRVLTDELTQLERNRGSIVDRLRGLVESSLATLRAAQRLSRLPEGLGEWSGQEFLRIRFEDPDQTVLAERLGEVIDEATMAAVKKNSDLRRDGMSLLLRAVAAAIGPKGVSVEILKPDAVLRAERVSVGQMSDVFSGGQLLTAAIALYCTMAALRANDRGQSQLRHAGTLFLDNPIGRANATYLLELQRAVADALGVQLIYTTGLFDTTALAEFPLVIRLRNDADLRAGLKYISVEEHLRPGLPAPQDPDGPAIHGEITATRMFKRPAEAPAAE